jgi:acetyltransferase-like isoleucine patch superfamily enzyme
MNDPWWETPWKLDNHLWRILAYPRIRLLFARYRISWGKCWRFYGVPILQKHRSSSMSFGDGLQLRSSVRSNPLGPNHPVILCTWQAGAVLRVGNDFAMTGGALCAAESIVIGEGVAVGANTIIADTDFHPLSPAGRLAAPEDGETSPITIDDFVFIGMNCLVLKGVTIGAGAVIGAGSVVTRDIPAQVIAAGNPARVLRELVEIPTGSVPQAVLAAVQHTGEMHIAGTTAGNHP